MAVPLLPPQLQPCQYLADVLQLEDMAGPRKEPMVQQLHGGISLPKPAVPGWLLQFSGCFQGKQLMEEPEEWWM